MVSNPRLRLSLLAALACGVIVAAGAVASAQSSKSKALLLPDLVQAEPADVSVRVVEGEARLGFASAVNNTGAGPLIVKGSRTRTQKEMSVNQLIDRENGTRLERKKVGRFRYTKLPDHSHWHYLRFDRYFVRPAGGTTVAADQKSGFCIGDNYDAYLEGQHVVIQGLAAGRYELVHHANADRRLLEERYDNNTSCVAFDLSWSDGRPSISDPEPCS